MGRDLGGGYAVRHLEHRVQTIRSGFVGTENAEVVERIVQLEHVAQHVAEHARGFGDFGAGLGNLDGVGAKIRQMQIPQQQAAVGVRIRAHAPRPFGRQLGQLGNERAVAIEQLLGTIALHPVFEHLQVVRLGGKIRERNLMGAESAFHLHAVHHFRAGPAFGRFEDDHGPQRALGESVLARVFLNRLDLFDDGIERRRHGLVHRLGLVARSRSRADSRSLAAVPPIPARDARQHGGAGDFVAVQMQNRKHRAVARGIEEFVGMPAGGQRAGLGFAVADHAAGDQIGIVEHRAVSVQQRVAQLAAFIDRSGSLGRGVARNAAWK